jgi:hypothetical protein
MLLHTDLSEQAIQPTSFEAGHERRSRPRVSLSLPLVLIRPGDETRIETQTRDVTCDSFYCVSDRPLSPGEVIECELFIAGESVSSVPTDDLRLSCRARVVRVVPRQSQDGFDVACRLEEYSITGSAA